ncbi:hypothetical protein MBLNU459_g0017t1 [Dothideomycetes sp. NU459]
MLPLCASPLRCGGATRFYHAFYRCTCLGAPAARPSFAVHSGREHFRPYSSEKAILPAQQQQHHDQESLPDQPLPHGYQRTTLAIKPDHYAALAASNSDLLKKVSRLTNVRLRLDPSDNHRLILSGNSKDIQFATGYIADLANPSAAVLSDPSTPSSTNTASDGVGTPDPAAAKEASKPDDPHTHIRSITLMFKRAEWQYVRTLDEKTISAIRLSAGVQTLMIDYDPTNANRPYIRVSGTEAAIAKAEFVVRTILLDHMANIITPSFRESMRAVPNPVAVIATGRIPAHGTWDQNTDLQGMTVSSFTPVTLKPIPVISFNIRTPSRTLDALRKYGYFTLHTLASNADGATIADAFTKPYNNPADAFRILHETGRDISIRQTENRAPQIIGPGVLTRFMCKIFKSTEVGDHVVVFAEVSGVLTREQRRDDDGHQQAAVQPISGHATALAYAHGKYCAVAESIELESTTSAKEAPAQHSERSIHEVPVPTNAKFVQARETLEPESIEPQSIEPESIEPQSIEPESIEPESIEPKSIEPESIEPESMDPESIVPETENLTQTSGPGTMATSSTAQSSAHYAQAFYADDTYDKDMPQEESRLRPSAHPLRSTVPDITSIRTAFRFSSVPPEDPARHATLDPAAELEISRMTVGEFLARPDGKSHKMHLRLKQKAFLEASLEKLEDLKQNGIIADDDEFIARQYDILRLRQDVIDNQLDEAEWDEFVARMSEDVDEEEVAEELKQGRPVGEQAADEPRDEQGRNV